MAKRASNKSTANKTRSGKSGPRKSEPSRIDGQGSARVRGRKAAAKPKLLSGGNPQIAKADGHEPVRAYIEAMPGWKREVGAAIDAVIDRAVPGVRKAVRWNSPFFGVAGKGWIVGIHCFTKYVKVAFFQGSLLTPPPPVGSKDPNARYLHIHEGEAIDERQLASWVKQASRLEGWGKVP
jgi:hypothetical protein